MKTKIVLLLCISFFTKSAKAQCHLPTDISMDSTANLLWQQYLEKGDLKYEEITRKSYDRAKKSAADPRLDSLFRVSRQYMVDHLGEEVFCEKVGMEMSYAFNHIPSTFDIRYHFFLDKPGGDNFYKPIQFIFLLKKRKGYDKQAHFPKLPNCRDSASLCDFKVAHVEQVIETARNAGWIQDDEIEHGGVNDNWAWQVTKVINDDCGMQDMFIDPLTGEHWFSEIYARRGCSPLAEKVRSSPIVIEGTVLEDAEGYHVKNGIWSGRTVEVNRIFKGEMPSGVVEVVSWGGKLGSDIMTMTHGTLRLPPKGSTAIFFLTTERNEYNEEHLQTIENLSPYPIYQARDFPLELYQPYGGYRSLHKNIEQNTYQCIEKAAGQKRKTLLLPSERDSAFADFAMSKRMVYPQRKLGLEYRLFNKYSSRYRPKEELKLDLGIRSPSSHSYLTRSKVVIRYSPIAYGDSIVSKNRLEMKPIRHGSLSYRELLTPDNYGFEMMDLSDSTFQIEIFRRKGKGEYFQVTPWRHPGLPALPIVELRLPILNKEADLRFYFMENEMQGPHFHYDFEKNEEVPYSFVWPNDMPDFPVEGHRRK